MVGVIAAILVAAQQADNFDGLVRGRWWLPWRSATW
jgi:hypothetical protein